MNISIILNMILILYIYELLKLNKCLRKNNNKLKYKHHIKIKMNNISTNYYLYTDDNFDIFEKKSYKINLTLR